MRSWCTVASSRRSSGSASWISSTVMSTPVSCRSCRSSRSLRLSVGRGCSANSVRTPPRPAMFTPVRWRLALPVKSAMAAGMMDSTRRSIMPAELGTRSTSQPRPRAMSSNSVTSVVLPIPREPEITRLRSAVPGPAAIARRNPVSAAARPAQNRGEAPNVGRNGLVFMANKLRPAPSVSSRRVRRRIRRSRRRRPPGRRTPDRAGRGPGPADPCAAC